MSAEAACRTTARASSARARAWARVRFCASNSRSASASGSAGGGGGVPSGAARRAAARAAASIGMAAPAGDEGPRPEGEQGRCRRGGPAEARVQSLALTRSGSGCSETRTDRSKDLTGAAPPGNAGGPGGVEQHESAAGTPFARAPGVAVSTAGKGASGMRRKAILFGVLALVLGGLVALRLRAQAVARGAPPGGSGEIEGTEVNLSARITARVESLAVKKGQPVKAGDLLVKLDCSDQ